MGVHKKESLILLKLFRVVLAMGVHRKNNIKNFIHIFFYPAV